jgi:hypothetical protein
MTSFPIFQDISIFSKTTDYLPIINGALLTDMIVMTQVVSGGIKSVSLQEWYRNYGLSSVGADVLSIIIGVIITRFLYSKIFSKFSIFLFCGLAVIVQVIHDLLFYLLFTSIPRGKSRMLDTFKDYSKEFGPIILLADASMMISTITLSSLFASMNMNTNIILLIVALYIVPYLLYSI